jgi:hypothetical protein
MNRLTNILLLLLPALVAVGALPQARAEKNIIAVEYRDLPAHFESLPQDEAPRWNFNFRPYGAMAASFLWSDPIMQRSVMTGDTAGDKEPTAIYVCCNAEGFTVLVYAIENKMQANLEKGLSLPSSTLECFFAPGDADTAKIEHYYQFMCQATEPKLVGVYPWLMEDRSFRGIHDDIRIDAKTLANGNLIKIFVPWAPLFDRLPLTPAKRDNLWRLSVIRWASSGAQTWGGVVHAANSAGYIRFPAFTDAQKTAIWKTNLLKAWTRYKNTVSDASVNPGKTFERLEPFYVETLAKLPQTFKNVNEDFGFRRAWLEPAIQTRDALGAGIAAFDTLSQTDQEAFYAKAADLLFNFSYDLDQAYGDYLAAKLFTK